MLRVLQVCQVGAIYFASSLDLIKIFKNLLFLKMFNGWLHTLFEAQVNTAMVLRTLRRSAGSEEIEVRLDLWTKK